MRKAEATQKKLSPAEKRRQQMQELREARRTIDMFPMPKKNHVNAMKRRLGSR